MKMRRSPYILFVCIVAFSSMAFKQSESNWSNFRLFFQALRDTNTMVENTIAFIKTYNPEPGSHAHITEGITGKDYTEMAIAFSQSDTGAYTYLLEVWTKSGSWMKAMEFNFNDSTDGKFVWEPYAFDQTYKEGTMDMMVYDHSSSEKSVSWDVAYGAGREDLDLMKATVSRAGNIVTVYMTIHLDSSYVGDATNDAYLIGAKISTSSPNRATLVCGAADIGDDYAANGFTWDGTANTNNAGLFNSDGFVSDASSDGSYGGDSYPDPSNIDAANLPAASAVNAVSVDFADTTDTPDFL